MASGSQSNTEQQKYLHRQRAVLKDALYSADGTEHDLQRFFAWQINCPQNMNLEKKGKINKKLQD